MPSASLTAFDASLEATLREVHEIYRHCFASEPSLADEGNLSFTGVDLDAGTLQTLQKLGFHDAERVAQTIANWHRGTIRSMRSARARELLTELTPNLLRALGSTADPDAAFTHFTRFLERLPAVVQLFSLLQSNPQILKQLAVIMGNAPSLAAHLGRHPDWFDILLTAQYHNILGQPPSPGDYLQYQDHEEEWIGALCRFRNEREFLIGTEILMGKLDPLEGNRLLTATADAALTTLTQAVRRRFEQSHGTIPGSGLAILALGRYGSHDLTFGSDLDLIFLYDAKNDQAVSNGEKSHTATVYYNRLAQRLTGSLEAQTPEGRLYAIDTRLRPGGKDSLLATSLAAFEKYFTESAWSFEKMALLRHRIIYADTAVKKKLTKALEVIYRQPVDANAFRRDVAEMRERIAREHPPTDTWRTKYARGGLIDLVFLAQTLAITSALPDLLQPSIPGILRAAGEQGLLTSQDAETLINAWDFQLRLSCLLRLCKRDFTEETAPRGLLAFLARSFDAPDYTHLKQRLLEHQHRVQSLFNHYIKGDPRP